MTMENAQVAGVDYLIQYHVIIDGSSPLAQLHAEGASGFMQFPASAGHQAEPGPRHPVLHCSAVNIQHSNLLGFSLVDSANDPSPLMVWIPYTQILGIVEVKVPIPKVVQEGDEDGKVVSITSAIGKSASRYLN